MKMHGVRLALVLAVALALLLTATAATAAEIEASNYVTTTNGMPYAIAKAKGFFKEAGADVTGVRGSEGGGTSIRNMLVMGDPAVSSLSRENPPLDADRCDASRTCCMPSSPETAP